MGCPANWFLVAAAGAMAPGRALDLSCREGNWLNKDREVTAVDFLDVAIAQDREMAVAECPGGGLLIVGRFSTDLEHGYRVPQIPRLRCKTGDITGPLQDLESI